MNPLHDLSEDGWTEDDAADQEGWRTVNELLRGTTSRIGLGLAVAVAVFPVTLTAGWIRNNHWRRQIVLLACSASVIAGTLVVVLWPSVRTSAPDGFDHFFERPASVQEAVANVLLFLPAGLIASMTWSRRHPGRRFLWLLSPAVELLQGAVPSLYRQASAFDIALNSAGIALGLATVDLIASRFPSVAEQRIGHTRAGAERQAQ